MTVVTVIGIPIQEKHNTMEKLDDVPLRSYNSLRFYFFSDKIHLKTNEEEELTFDRIDQLEEPLRNATVKSLT